MEKTGRNLTGDRETLKRQLVSKYRDVLVRKITPGDLTELQEYLRNQYDPDTGWDPVIRRKFEQKLREYLHEEILTREIAGIEALLPMLKPSDLLKKPVRKQT